MDQVIVSRKCSRTNHDFPLLRTKEEEEERKGGEEGERWGGEGKAKVFLKKEEQEGEREREGGSSAISEGVRGTV